jgi:hypothetical protein
MNDERTQEIIAECEQLRDSVLYWKSQTSVAHSRRDHVAAQLATVRAERDAANVSLKAALRDAANMRKERDALAKELAGMNALGYALYVGHTIRMRPTEDRPLITVSVSEPWGDMVTHFASLATLTEVLQFVADATAPQP